MNLHFDTNAIHGGQQVDKETGARAVPVHRTTSYVFNDTEHAANLFNLKELGYIYTRLGNPTQAMLEDRMAILEGGKAAVAFASGTSAIQSTVLNICSQGDEIISSNKLYGGTFTMFNNILPQLGIATHFIDPTDISGFEAAITDNTKLLYCEVIGNPTLDITDISKLGELGKKYNIPVVVDSTFTPPSLLRPIEYGADIVIHSLTKWIGGHGTAIGGIVVDAGTFNWDDAKFPFYSEPDDSYHGIVWARDLGALNDIPFALRLRTVPLRNLGACISPDNAWIFLQGLETLSLRMERHCENAEAVAKHLSEHPKAAWVRYPGLSKDPSYHLAETYLPHGKGGMVVFGIKGGAEAGKKFIDSLDLFSHVANVGDAKSLAIHPATTTHSQLSSEHLKAAGLSPDLIRLSIGIEHKDDIIRDLDKALNSV